MSYGPSSPEVEKTLEAQPSRLGVENPKNVDEGYDIYVSNLEGRKNVERTAEESVEWEAKSKRIAQKYDRWLLGMM